MVASVKDVCLAQKRLSFAQKICSSGHQPDNHFDRIQAATQTILYAVMHFAVPIGDLGSQKRPIVFVHVFHQINVHFFADQSDHICSLDGRVRMVQEEVGRARLNQLS